MWGLPPTVLNAANGGPTSWKRRVMRGPHTVDVLQ
jgi:hypothetical protein